MPNKQNRRHAAWPLATAIGLAAAMACASTRADDTDALALGGSTAEAPVTSPLRLALELGGGTLADRWQSKNVSAHRAAFDLRYSQAVGSGLRVAFSDRVDDVHPTLGGQPSTVNSLREAFASWQSDDAATVVDFGRVNVRNGPAFGFNPTDFLRTGALRTITTADPVALRENRMGVAMLRVARQEGNAGLTLVLAPKVASAPSQSSWSADFGATNDRARALLALNARLAEGTSGQLFAVATRNERPRWGFNLTTLAGDSAVIYAEYAESNEQDLLDVLTNSGAPAKRQRKAALGLTYTLPSKLSLTLEADANSRGLRAADFASWLAQGPNAYLAYAALTQPSQELGARRAWTFYLTQKELGLKQLDLTALVRRNAEDHSTLGWLELRYHWPRIDAALQFQTASGSAFTEFGAMPYRRVAQLLLYAYF